MTEAVDMVRADESQGIKVTPKSKLFDLILIALIGLSLQAFWVSRLTEPTYMDAYYYATNGQRIADGHGFSEMILWQFLDDPAGLPTPSHTYWMPLPSILAAAGYLASDSFTGAQLPFWLLGGLLPILAYIISQQLTGQRWQAWAAAMFTAVAGYYATFLGQPSTFAPFAWAGGLTLLFTGLAISRTGETAESRGFLKPGRRLYWLAAGVCSGFAHLTRADGIILLFVAVFFWLMQTLRSRKGNSQTFAGGLGQLALLLVGYLLVMGPWFLRNLLATGALLPTTGTQSIFLTTYDDLFAYGRSIDVNSFFEWGWQNIFQSRVDGAISGLTTLLAVPALIFLTPFIIVAGIFLYRRRSSRTLLQPFLLYLALLYLTTVLLFTFPGIRGTLFHSSIALWPWTTALAVAGIGVAVDWAAARLSHWQPQRAKKTFSALFIGLALVLTVYISQFRLSPDRQANFYHQIMEEVPSDAIVMVGNAPALYYYTGLAAVSVPNEPLDTLLAAADRYGVGYLVLDQNRPNPLDDFYEGDISHERLHLINTLDDVQLYEIRPTR